VPAYGALAVAFAVVEYFELFTHFRDYDDEGYIALSVREFVAGGSLYGDVYSRRATGLALGAASLDRPGVVPGTQTFEKTTKRAAMTSNLNGALLASPILGVTSGGPPASHKAIGLKRSAPHPLAPERAR
jgi:hypothetical protein